VGHPDLTPLQDDNRNGDSEALQIPQPGAESDAAIYVAEFDTSAAIAKRAVEMVPYEFPFDLKGEVRGNAPFTVEALTSALGEAGNPRLMAPFTDFRWISLTLSSDL